MNKSKVEVIKARILLTIQLLGAAMFMSSIWNKSGAVLLFVSLVLTMTPNLLTGRWRARLGCFMAIIGVGFIGIALHVGLSPAWAISGVIVITAGAYQIFKDSVDNVSVPRKALEKISSPIK